VDLINELYLQSSTQQKLDFDGHLRMAKRHLDIIKKFNRYPHRNKLLGRISTPEEEIFLKNNHYGFMQSVEKRESTVITTQTQPIKTVTMNTQKTCNVM